MSIKEVVDMINSKNKIIFLVSVLAIILVMFLSGCSQKETGAQLSANTNTAASSATTGSTAAAAAEQEMVDCSNNEDPFCFVTRMNQCLPVTAKMTGTDGATTIDITVLGQANETCHFQRKINDALNLDCYFPRGTLNMDTLDQTFGNDKGLQKVVDDNCKMAGW